jgi:hypothetical protein
MKRALQTLACRARSSTEQAYRGFGRFIWHEVGVLAT